jgi:hypothetical protein
MNALSDNQIEKIDKLVERLNAEMEWTDDYHTTNEDNPTADYVASIGFGEMMHQVEDALKRSALQHELEPDEFYYLKSLVNSYHPNKAGSKDIVNKIIEITNLSFEASYYANDLELCSLNLGEIEHQVDDALADEINTLSDEEYTYFERKIDCSYLKRTKCLYTDHSYSRWYLELNIDLLREKMTPTKMKLEVVK